MTSENEPALGLKRKVGERSNLLSPDWQYIEARNIGEYTAKDWALLNRQRAEYEAKERARQAMDLLTASKDAPTFGYMINNYEHCMQTATMLYHDGHDEETIVTGLFHDVGFIVCPENHARFSADLIRPFISEKNAWMLEHHEVFQRIHLNGFFEIDWNNEFIEQLLDAGYKGETNEAIVDAWFQTLIRQMLGEEGQSTDAQAGYINVVPIDKGKSEVS